MYDNQDYTKIYHDNVWYINYGYIEINKFVQMADNDIFKFSKQQVTNNIRQVCLWKTGQKPRFYNLNC